MWWLYIIAVVAGFFVSLAFVLIGTPVIGTMYIDMDSRDEKDIARIVFSKPLEEIAGYSITFVKVEKKSGLSSFDGKL